MEQILIKNFGPVEEVYISDIRKITIFVGESGSGKSTIMKLISLFRWIYKMVNIRSFLKHSGIKKSPFRFSFVNLLKNSGMLGYIKPNTVLEYHNNFCHLIWDSNGKTLKGTNVYIPKTELSLEKISFISDKRNIIPDLVDNNTSIKKNMFYPNETYSDFETAVETVKELDVLNLGVHFVVKRTPQGLKYMIVSGSNTNDFGIKLNEASSGTQNIVTMNVIVEYYSKYYDLVASINNAILSYVSKSDQLSDFKAVKNIGDFASKNVHLIIEEPELSLFPSSQTSLMDFLTDSVYGNPERDYNMTLMLATHSPYIISHLNVLLRRSIKNNDKQGLVRKEDLSVFRVFDGKIQSVVGEDIQTGETMVNMMDLNEEMDNIYNEYISLKN